MTLITTPNIEDADGIYQKLIALHEGRSDADSMRVNARLILLLLNHIGDPETMKEAIDLAGGEIEQEEYMIAPFSLSRIHHVAYRCKDAKETVEWYKRVLGMRFTNAFAEDHVPSTGAYDPYMHVFLDCGGGNVLAFFELPNQPDMGRDENTPAWVQHIAFEVPNREALHNAKAHIEALGIDVLGPTYHGIFRSIYFFDPNGHRVELACNIGTSEQHAELKRVAPLMLEEWARTKKAPRHADWLHKDPES